MNDSAAHENFQVGNLIRRRYGTYRYRIVAIAPNGALFGTIDGHPSAQTMFGPADWSDLERVNQAPGGIDRLKHSIAL